MLYKTIFLLSIGVGLYSCNFNLMTYIYRVGLTLRLPVRNSAPLAREGFFPYVSSVWSVHCHFSWATTIYVDLYYPIANLSY